VKWGSEHGPLRFKRIEDISDIVTSSWIEEEKQ